MSLRRYLLAGGLLAFGAWLAFLLRTPPASTAVAPGAKVAAPARLEGGGTSQAASLGSPSAPVFGGVKVYVEGQPAFAAPDVAELATTSRPPLADELGAPNTLPLREPQIVIDVLNAYRRLLGAYPAGEDNRQMVNALLGANAHHLPFIPRDHPRLNGRGEIVDAWDTPFFFHLNSRTSIDVRSAGPDRALFTSDDLVSSSTPPVVKRHAIADRP